MFLQKFIKHWQRVIFFQALGWYLLKTIRAIFLVSSVTFFVFAWLEFFKTGLISNYFDLNWLLLIAFVCLIIHLLADQPEQMFSWFGQLHRAKNFYLLMVAIALVIGLMATGLLLGLGNWTWLSLLVIVPAVYLLASQIFSK